MPTFIHFALSCAAVFLVGCSSIPNYQQPEGAGTAKLRVVVPNPDQFSLHLAKVDLAACKFETSIGWVSGGARIDTERVGMLDSVAPQHGVLERRVASGHPIAIVPSMTVAMLDAATILFSMNPATHGRIHEAQQGACAVPVFSPKPGEQYELSIQMTAGDKCLASVNQLSLNGEGKVSRTLVKDEGQVLLPVRNKPIECLAAQPSTAANF